MRFKEEALNEAKNTIKHEGISFLVNMETKGNGSYIKLQFIPKTSKELDRVKHEEDWWIDELENNIKQQTGLDFEYVEDDGGAGYVFYADRHEFHKQIMNRL